MSEQTQGLATATPADWRQLLGELHALMQYSESNPDGVRSDLKLMGQYFGVTNVHEAHQMVLAGLTALNASHLHVQAAINAYTGEGSTINIRRMRFCQEQRLAEWTLPFLEDAGLKELVRELDRRHTAASVQGTPMDPIAHLLDKLIATIQDQTATNLELAVRFPRR